MPRWNLVTILAGVDFSNCRALIQNGSKFGSIYRGSAAIAADGTPHIQRVNTGPKGIKFGCIISFANASDLTALRSAVEAAEAASTPFRVQLQDAQVTLDLDCWPDYDVDEWLSTGPESEGVIENVIIRLLSVGPH